MYIRITVNMASHPWNNPKRPYYWFIDKMSVIVGDGYSETPEKAWHDALNYYNNHIKE